MSTKNEGCWYKRPRPYLAVDCVVFTYFEDALRVLLRYRRNEKSWALPGRFMLSAPPAGEDGEYGEDAETVPQCLRHALAFSATPVRGADGNICLSGYYKKDNPPSRRSPAEFQKDEFVIQLPVRSQIRRDEARENVDGSHPNYRVVSLPFLMAVTPEKAWSVGTYTDYEWVPIDFVQKDNDLGYNGIIQSKKPRTDECYTLAFDHRLIFADACKSLKLYSRSYPIGREFLSRQFCLTDLRHLYEYVYSRKIDTSNFWKSIVKRARKHGQEEGLVVSVDTKEDQNGGTRAVGRPAKWVRFVDSVYDSYLSEGDFNCNFS